MVVGQSRQAAPPALHIPAIDLSPDAGLTDAQLAATLLEALQTVGFLHVLNPGPGLTQNHVREIFDIAARVFALPLEVKASVGFDVESGAGYTTMFGQTTGSKLDRLRGDVKESFSIGPKSSSSLPFDHVTANTTATIEAFRKACFDCGARLLELFALALNMSDDPLYFRARHTYHRNESLRLIHYPPFLRAAEQDRDAQDRCTPWAELKITEKDARAGPHQDFGSATLLFQSPPDLSGNATAAEGLEIFVPRDDGPSNAPDGTGRRGWWTPAPLPPVTGRMSSILVNVGVSMEVWSGEKFKATWHRVVCPLTVVPGEMLPGRQSVVFFMIPDSETILTPIDGDGRPAAAEGCESLGDMFKLRMKRAYGVGEKLPPC